jgi:hypothetical protein
MSIAAGKEVSTKKRRRKRVVPINEEDAEEIEQELVRVRHRDFFSVTFFPMTFFDSTMTLVMTCISMTCCK